MNNKKKYWIPISAWNLNEIFISESISPMSFYSNRYYGNKISRENEVSEGENYLTVFKDKTANDIHLCIYNYDFEVKQNNKQPYFFYDKTIYLTPENFKIHFNNQRDLDNFTNNTLLLLEVKLITKYKEINNVFEVGESIYKNATVQHTISPINKKEIFSDRAYNQIKGLVYGWFAGNLLTFDNEQERLLVMSRNLKNITAGFRTNTILSDEYSQNWMFELMDSTDKLIELFDSLFPKLQFNLFTNLKLRIKEIDRLNKEKFIEIKTQNSTENKSKYNGLLDDCEKVKKEIHEYNLSNNITKYESQLNEIKDQEKQRGQQVGKKRLYFKKDTHEYMNKIDLKEKIYTAKNNYKYKDLKIKERNIEEELKNYTFGFTKYDSAIEDEFSKVTDYIIEINREIRKLLLKKNNGKRINLQNIKADKNILADSFKKNEINTDVIKDITGELRNQLGPGESKLLETTLNAVLLNPQGYVGCISDDKIIEIITIIGKKIPNGKDKDILREFYNYKTNKPHNFSFPNKGIVRNILIFLMKASGYNEIIKMHEKLSVPNKEITLMIWGAFMGFSNLPKTLTNSIFTDQKKDSINSIDQYLFESVINQK